MFGNLRKCRDRFSPEKDLQLVGPLSSVPELLRRFGINPAEVLAVLRICCRISNMYFGVMRWYHPQVREYYLICELVDRGIQSHPRAYRRRTETRYTGLALPIRAPGSGALPPRVWRETPFQRLDHPVAGADAGLRKVRFSRGASRQFDMQAGWTQ